MKREDITLKSKALGKDAHVIVYGEKGYPIVAFQTQNKKATELEDEGMVDTLSEYLDDGKVQLFSVDNFDEDSWSKADGDNAERAQRQEAYFRFVTDELLPRVHEVNGSNLRPIAFGCSMGAVHAAIALFRRPDLFQGCMALSGIYHSGYFFGDWMDSTLYDNDLLAFLPNMPEDHPYVQTYRNRSILFCCGQGEGEEFAQDERLVGEQLTRLGVDHWCDYWGADVTHDWYWWKKQMAYFLPFVLEDVQKEVAKEPVAPFVKPAKAATKPAAKAAEKVAAPKAATKTAAAKAAPKAAAKAAEPEPAAAKKAEPKAAAPAKKATPAKKAAAKPVAKAAAAKKSAAKPAAKAEAKAAPAKAEAAKPAAKKAEPKAAAAPAKKAAATKKAPAAHKATTVKAATKPVAAPKAAAAPAAKTTSAKAAAKPAAKAAATKPATKAATEKSTTAAKPAAKATAPAAKPAAKATAAKPAAATKPATSTKSAAKTGKTSVRSSRKKTR